jgi:RHS repeat-associated protein
VFSYDHRGNLLVKRQPLGLTSAKFSYSYDRADRVVEMRYPSGRIVQYQRDAKGRVLAVRTKADASVASWTDIATTMQYEAFGALTSASLGNGQSFAADYDNDDNITGISDALTPANNVSYGYDAVGRLTQVTTASGTTRRTDFQFDANGNRTAKLTRALPDDPESAALVDSYATDDRSNQLDGITGAGGSRSFVYDGRGNLTTETRSGGVTVSAGYDGHGRLTGYTRTGDAAQTNVYNGLDQRVTVTSGSTIRRFVYDPDGRVLGEYGTSASNVIAERIWLTPEIADGGMFGGDDGTGGYAPIAIVAGTTLSWVHGNHLGVPLLYTNASGAAIATPAYTLPGFPGQFKTFADLYYNQYRDYDPTTGRYIQADPIGLAGGQAPYLYAAGNPVRYTDPTGRIVPLALCTIGAVANTAATGIGQYISGDFDGSDLAVAAGVGCVGGILAPVAGPGGAAALGGITSVAQYGLSRWLNGCRPTARGVLTNLIVGTFLGKILGRSPGPQKFEWDLWKEPWKGYNRHANGQPHIEAAADGFKDIPISGAANAGTDWLVN